MFFGIRVKTCQIPTMIYWFMPFLFVLILVLLAPLPLKAEEERRLPTWQECRLLADEKTPAKDKMLLQLSFFPRLPWCEINTRPFKVHHVFSAGFSEARLKLIISEKNVYEIAPDSLMAALMPDRNAASGTQAAQLAGQIFGLVMGAMNAAVDPIQMTLLIGKMGTLAGSVGANAALIQKEIAGLRQRHHFAETDIVVPSWVAHVAGGKSIKNALEGQGNAPPKNFVEKFFRALGKFLRLLGMHGKEHTPLSPQQGLNSVFL